MGRPLPDPFYNLESIKQSPEDYLAYILSEALNDNAPIGWSRYKLLTRTILKEFDIKIKEVE